MPLMMDGNRTPASWAGMADWGLAESFDSPATPAGYVKIALVNNMPDPALEDTELQFFELLDEAAGGIPVHLQLCSLPRIPRGERAQRHLDSCYISISDLLNSRFDGVIITGTEPHQPDLLEEPYWGALTEVLDWTQENTYTTVLSCLAAHAGVLYSDGIGRHPLQSKRFGVFEHEKISSHPMTSRTADRIHIPHSRWNEVQEDDLTSAGYLVLTKSPEAGVDLFVKKKKNSLFVHFQGHPEYGARTLLKEYRRDVKRYLRGERDMYPLVPHQYFSPAATQLSNDFRDTALNHPNEDQLKAFPEAGLAETLKNTWRASATQLYRNWLQYIATRKAETSVNVAVARAGRA
jgi:homoserine O-succinyltransferase